MREFFDKIVNSRGGTLLDKYYNSPFYAGTVGVVCILCHTLNIPVVGALLLMLLIVPSLVLCKNSFVLLPIMLMGGFVISYETKPTTGYYNTPLRISALCIAAVVILAALVFNFVYYGKWRKIFKRAYLSVSMAIITGALLVSGFNAPWFSVSGVGMTFAIALTMFLPYSFLLNCGDYRGRKTVEYFVWVMIVASIVIAAAVLKQYALYGFDTANMEKGYLEFGYAVSNSAAAIVLLAIPLTFYMVYTYKHGYLFFIAIAVQLLTIYFTMSRSSLLVAVPGILIVAIALCFKKKTGRLGYYIAFGVVAACVIGVLIKFGPSIIGKVSALFAGNVTLSGRTTIWKRGFEVWTEYPIFGVGVWYLPQVNIGHHYHSYHCTPLTYLFCYGVVGLAAYIYHRYKTVRLAFSTKLTAERVFIMLTISALLINSLLDIYMTEPLHLMYYSVMLALIEFDVRKVKAENEAAKNVSQSDPTSDRDETQIIDGTVGGS